uniref:C-type lectin domain-containing protein n=1 Tax=Astyanax mexicanus TaxID=7994 RepID=A0A3B1IRH0_ASTMX
MGAKGKSYIWHSLPEIKISEQARFGGAKFAFSFASKCGQLKRPFHLAGKTYLTMAADQLKISNQNLTKERDQLKISNQNLTEERDQLKTKNSCVKRCMKSGRCYLLFSGWKTWTESRKDCRERGADLVIIKSQEEQVRRERERERERERVGKWVDGSGLTGSSYWRSGEPNNSGGNGVEEDCALFMSLYEQNSALQTWNDMNCSIKRSWVCELKPADQ